MPNLSLKPEEADYLLSGMFPGEGPELRDRSFVSNDPGMPQPEAGPERPEPAAPSVSSPLGTIASTSEMGQPARPVVGGKNYPRPVAALGTIDRAQEDASLHDYQASHPWGTPDNHPGLGGKIAHVLGKIGGTALSVASPGVAAMFPQTPLGRIVQQRQDLGNIAGLQKEKGEEDLRKANIEHLGAETDALRNPQKDANPDDWKVVPDTNWLVNSKTGETKQAEGVPTPEGKGSEEEKAYKQALESDPKLTRAQFHQTWQNKTEKTSTKEDLQQRIAVATEKGDAREVKRLQAELKAIDPMGAERLNISFANLGERKDEATRKDVTAHDRAYVQPAEQVEKSYQMMQHAYDEYKQAAAQGKKLPTGAQSMLALSTHLATTFGNVKGARVTKDMIEHHLGARGISDSAVVAIQKLTNGDVLSPAQWEAFHDLISQSRKLSWDTATKEAKRKQIPVDFLPEDLTGGGSASNAPPAGAKVRDYTQLGK